MNVDVKIKIEDINEEEGTVVVRFINPYGVIETGEKTMEDFRHVSVQPTGNFDDKGQPLTFEEVWYDENPNADIVFNYDIPLDENGDMYNKQQFLDWIILQFPHDMVVKKDVRRRNPIDPQLVAMVGEEVEGRLILGEPEEPVEESLVEDVVVVQDV